MAYRNSDITPIYIRAVQGHSGTKELDTQKMSTWEVNEKHTYILYHAGHRHKIDSILRNGLLAGGATDKPSRRKHCYFSIRDPRRAARGDPSVKKAWGDPSGRREEQEDAADVASGITTRPYPIHDKNLDALYQIDLKRARELGLHFYQTPSYAVLCDENIPPECILKITDMRDQVLYRNELLLACAPGDRPAYVQIGTALQNTKFHFDIDVSSLDRSTIELITDKAERDALFMKQYCCKFHNERICVKCHTFNMKGLVHCVSCGAAEQREPSKAKGTYVSVQDQIEFTNAELRTLVYKRNSKFRGNITNSEAILKARARKHLKRAKGMRRQKDGTYRSFTSIIDRWDNDEGYREQLQQDEHLTREDAVHYDYLAAQQTKEVKMQWDERKSRMRNHAWDVVQGRGGGSQTIKTTLYPTYEAAVEAKASAPPPSTASSSSSWNQQWWSQSSTTPPWKQGEWQQKRW